MDKHEVQWDKRLKIDTIGRNAKAEDQNHYPYEPTPYSVLERLAQSGYLSKKNSVVDYGCGKGRVDFFLNWKIGCHMTGVEFDESIYQIAIDNQKSCSFNHSTNFKLLSAQDYEISALDDCFYFFNPFSLKVLQAVIGKIRASWLTFSRKMKLFFYYPSDEYIRYLMSVRELILLDEIDCKDLFQGENKRECILVFEMEL